MGLLEGNAGQVGNQIVGVLISWGVAIVGSLVLLKVTDLLVGLRVTEEEEIQGLDLSQHGEVGYDFES
jgi:Amt family ammonium transporter